MVAERTHSQVVQVIGRKKIVIYKENKDKSRKNGSSAAEKQAGK